MHHRAEYLLQVFEKIGAPLLTSILAVNAQGQGALHNEAQKIAELLAKTVHTSIEMSNSLDLGPMGEMTDSIRIALTGLAGPLVAASYRNNGKTPGEIEIKRIIAALQAVMTFSANFEDNSENSDRLKNISPKGDAVDDAQFHIQYIQAFTPVIEAVGAYSFGQQDAKLVMEISSRISSRAQQIRKSALGDLGDANRRAELGILKALAEIYAATHFAEIARMQSISEEERMQGGVSMDTLWQNFDVRAAMVHALAEGIAGKNQGAQNQGAQSTGSGSIAPQAAAPQTAAPQTAAPQANPPAPPTPIQPPPAQPSPAQPSPVQAPPANQSSQPAVNPMAFFKAPPKEGQQ